MEKEILFTIPYWKIQTINFEKKKKELTKLLESYPEEEKTGVQTFATNRPADRSGFAKHVSSIMNEELKALAAEIETDFGITEVWTVSYDKGDNQSPHNHSSMGLTAILYLDLSKDSPVTEYIQPWNDYEEDSCRYIAVPIVEGDIVLVPSFVFHFSNPNESNSKKRIISWDMKITYELARPGFYSDMKLS